MNHAQMSLLNALQHYIHGTKCELYLDDTSELCQLFHIASIQNVLPMVCEATCESEYVQKYQNIFSAYKKRAINEVVSQTVRTAQFLDLYQFLGDRGIYPVIVKGLAVRSLYPKENLRISVDEDLLIRPDEIQKYHHALLAYGLQKLVPDQDIEKASEISYIDSESGLYIEVHKYLMPPDSEAYGDLNCYFDKAQPVVMEYKDHKMLTMNPTDHVFFLICHSFKHFLHSGFGIRQISDLMLLSDVYADEIEWDRIWSQCKEIHAEGFVRALYQIGRKYLIPDNRCSCYLRKWQIENVDEEPLLLDVLESGIHGASDMNRLHSSNITLKAVINQKNKKNTGSSVWHSVFLPLEEMTGRYEYLQKAPFLLPAAWMQRIIHYIRELLGDRSSANNISDSIKLGRKRIELLKLYGILK
ncbi:MAG: nucleotidyltransferase family protein [Blautia sp.]|nr:nucleotidyltransferase family protein [Blautia sp.]